MTKILKNQNATYKAHFDRWESEIQNQHRTIPPMYPTGFNGLVETKQKISNHSVRPLLPVGVNEGDSFQVADHQAKIKMIRMPGERKGSIKMPLEMIAKLIEEKLLLLSEHYNPGVGSAMQLTEVSENGTFKYLEFFMGQKTSKWGSWTEESGSVSVFVNGKKII